MWAPRLTVTKETDFPFKETPFHSVVEDRCCFCCFNHYNHHHLPLLLLLLLKVIMITMTMMTTTTLMMTTITMMMKMGMMMTMTMTRACELSPPLFPSLLPSRRVSVVQLSIERIQAYTSNHLVGLVVKASASRAEGHGFESRLRMDFFGVESYQ